MNEPDFKSKSVTTRITLRSYAGLLQSMEKSGDPDMKISDVVRNTLDEKFGSVELEQKWLDWMDEQEKIARAKREEGRAKRRRFRHRIFGRIFGK